MAAFVVQAFLAAYSSVGPTITSLAATVGNLVPIAFANEKNTYPGSSIPPAEVTTNTLESITTVAGPVGPEIKFRIPLGIGGPVGGYGFRGASAFEVTIAGPALSTGRLRCHVRLLNADLSVDREITPALGVAGVAQDLTATTTYKDWFETVNSADLSPSSGKILEVGYQLEIVNAVAGTVTWRMANGAGSSGVTTLEVDTGGL
jgi:hypothetical protein